MKPFKEYDLGATLSNQYVEIKKRIESITDSQKEKNKKKEENEN